MSRAGVPSWSLSLALTVDVAWKKVVVRHVESVAGNVKAESPGLLWWPFRVQEKKQPVAVHKLRSQYHSASARAPTSLGDMALHASIPAHSASA